MAESFEFELVSPERLLVSEPATMAIIPGDDGLFGVLPDHAPMINTVEPGTLDVTLASGEARRLFVAGGFAEVTGARVTVLAEEAVALDALDRAAIEAELREVAEDFEAAEGGEKQRLGGKLKVLRAKLTALETAQTQ